MLNLPLRTDVGVPRLLAGIVGLKAFTEHFILAVTVILGLKLFKVSFVVIIIWIVVCVVLIIIMEIGLKVFKKSTGLFEESCFSYSFDLLNIAH